MLGRAGSVFGDESKADELEVKRFPVLGAYELALKCSHVFNLLDARGAISVTERVGVMARIRTLVIGVAKAYAAQGERLKSGGLRAYFPPFAEARRMGHPIVLLRMKEKANTTAKCGGSSLRSE